MGKQWFRHVLRRCGFDAPFQAVICPEDVKTIYVDPELGAKVTVRRTFVFLDVPEPGDLRDVIAEVGTEPERAVYESNDALETGRARRGRAMVLSWRPRQKVVPYGLYQHEYTWRPLGSYAAPALYTEVGCEVRTGRLVLEMMTPALFETAVAFRVPRWRRLATDRSLIQYALRQLDAGGQRLAITDHGKRLQWNIVGPKVGDRFICVVFHEDGVAKSNELLKATSLFGRLRQMMRFRPA